MYLLAAQTVLDTIAGHPKISAWMQGIPMRDVGIAAITLGRIQQVVDTVPPSDPKRGGLQNALAKLRGVTRSNGRVEAFDTQASMVWAGLLSLNLQRRNSAGVDVDLDDEDRMIAAIAIDRGLILVEAQQPYHSKLSGIYSFTAHDPY
jgi:predicted nucleic acid-binding protein